MAKPTDRQIELLGQFGIPAPASKPVASKMIGYILEGNGTRGGNEFQRAGYLRETLARYLGKRVKYRGSERVGLVTSIWPRGLVAISDLRDANVVPCPFQCAVRWDEGGHRGNCSLAYVELI